MTQFTAGLYDASTWVLPIVFAITFHEAAHGYVAWRLGDDTAYRRGRVSFNPLRHIDPFGTIVMPAFLLLTGSPFLFGYAKPVPVQFGRLHHPRRDMVLVAAAGPGINLLLATLSAALLHFVDLMPAGLGDWTTLSLFESMQINVVLAVFNMLPLPPLDGGRVAVGLLPPNLGKPLAKLERYGIAIILGVLVLLPLIGSRLGMNWSVASYLIEHPVEFIIRAIGWLVGIPFGS